MRIRLQNLMDYADGLKTRVAARLNVRPPTGAVVASGAFLAFFQTDNPNNFNAYLLGGYVTMSALCLLYMLTLHLRQRNLQQDVALLTQLVQEHDRPRR